MKAKLLIKNMKMGQSMIEVVIGMAVVVILAVSLITTTLITQRTATSAKNNSQATKLTQQTFEQLRVFRDRQGFDLLPVSIIDCYKLNTGDSNPSNWTFSTISGANCNDSANWEKVILDKVDFYRKIQIIDKTSTEKETTVTVAWTESAGAQSIEHKSLIGAWCSGQIEPGGPCSP